MTKVKFFDNYWYLPKLEDDLNEFISTHKKVTDIKYQMGSYGQHNNKFVYTAMIIYEEE